MTGTLQSGTLESGTLQSGTLQSGTLQSELQDLDLGYPLTCLKKKYGGLFQLKLFREYTCIYIYIYIYVHIYIYIYTYILYKMYIK